MSKLKELEGRRSEIHSRLLKVFGAVGEENDYSKPEVLKELGATDATDAVLKIRQLNSELQDLVSQIEQLRSAEEIRKQFLQDSSEPENRVLHPQPSVAPQYRTIGEAIVQSKLFAAFREGRTGKMVVPGFGLPELKANFVTTAGWPPESVRRPGLVIPPALRPIEVLDVIPTGQTDQAVVKWMDHSTATEAAAERNEAAAYPEETHALTEKSSTVRSIGASIPVSDEQLEDVPGVRAYLDQVLINSVRRRLDQQIINGDGVAPNLTGLLNVTGVLSQAKGTDPVFDAILKAVVNIRTTEFYSPNIIILNPKDWQDIRLERDSTGNYILGNPSESGPMTLFGLPVILSNSLTENTGLVGDLNFCTLFERRGIEVEVGYVNTQFKDGLRTIRAGLRVAFAVYRAKAFSKVTGI